MFAVIYIPDFALQSVLRHEPERREHPVALLDDSLPKGPILQMTGSARRAGVVEGLTSTQAMARCSDILIKNRSPAQETMATAALLHCAYAFSPHIESTASGVCTLDLKGLPIEINLPGAAMPMIAQRIEAWAHKILRQFELIHLRAQVGVAETPDLALLAARQARPVLLVEDAGKFLSALPIESIDPPVAILKVLRKWGIRALGAFVALGKAEIAERFGPEGIEMFEFASGREARPLKLAVPPETFEENTELQAGIESLQPLLFLLRRFVDQISCRLEATGQAAESLTLRLALSSGEWHERLFRVPAPTAHAETLFRTLCTHLETVRTDAPIVGLHLEAKPCRPGHHQFDLFEAALRDPNQFQETVARVSALLGSDRVGAPVIESSHRPDAFRMKPANFGSAESVALVNCKSPIVNPDGLALRRFRPAFPADVEVKNGRPVFISTLKFTSPVVKARGPWRRSGQWWEPSRLWQREEWDIQTSRGELYRVFCEGDRWCLEGVYD